MRDIASNRFIKNMTRIMAETGCSASLLSERSGIRFETIAALCRKGLGGSGGEEKQIKLTLPLVVKISQGLGCKLEDLLKGQDLRAVEHEQVESVLDSLVSTIMQNVRRLAAEKGITPTVLSKMSGLSMSTSWQYLNRDDRVRVANPNLKILVTLALTLGVDTCDLFVRSGPES